MGPFCCGTALELRTGSLAAVLQLACSWTAARSLLIGLALGVKEGRQSLEFEKEALFVSVLGTSISRKARQAFPAEPNPATFVICDALPVGRKKRYSQKWNERARRR